MNTVKILLRNISQVLLLENAITGLCILVGLFIGNWKVGLMALLGSIIALLLAKWTNYSEAEIEAGLAGFNPVLTAIALTLFLVPKWYSLVIVLLAVIITMPIGSAVREYFKPFGIPMLTIPYVFVSWLILLMSFQFKFVNANVHILPNKVQEITFSGNSVEGLQAFFTGFSEVFLLNHVITGFLILVGIFIASRRAAVYVIFANLIGLGAVSLLGANHDQINDGLFAYNVVLTVLALGIAFRTIISRTMSIVLGLLLTIILHAGMTTLLTPFGLPVFTLPFIIATWIMLFGGNRMKLNEIAESRN
ncbi:urea transporter [Staphylococcus gallinarum]|uniref:Urea transporter n=1 Tax=Staphylococcus gallinarum TaxID=1293 RepID=A0A418HRB5_STAGA|nr:urea transporter [Staphylococcus gallinarum]MCD8826722.1 urea transporter [Staphylococcus gallinarum]RIL44105.1 urea transporter [Staphylococcus gallinarum]RIO94445.1 urea transporter [Staphylococcus gallinarum]